MRALRITAAILLTAGMAAPAIDLALDAAGATNALSSRYAFASQTPPQPLTASVPQSVTLTPCPAGINGSDTDHYLRITDVSSGNENVLIAGGTCTSGAASGTVVFTPSRNHGAGSWVLESATGGIMEAISDCTVLDAPCTVIVPDGEHTVYAQITIKSTPSRKQHVAVRGQSRAGSVITGAAGFTGDALIWVTAVPLESALPDRTQYGISNLTLSQIPTKEVIRVGGPSNSDGLRDVAETLADLTINGGSIGIHFTGLSVKQRFRGLLLYGNNGGANYTGIKMDGATDLLYGYQSYIYKDDNPANAGHGIHIDRNSAVDAVLENIDVLGHWNNPFRFENSKGNRAPAYIYCTRCVADGTFNGDAMLVSNLRYVQIIDSWFVNHSTDANDAALKIYNSQDVTVSNCDLYSMGQGDVAITGGSATVTLNGNRLTGTIRRYFVDTANPATNVFVQGDNHSAGTGVLTNNATALMAATGQGNVSAAPVFLTYGNGGAGGASGGALILRDPINSTNSYIRRAGPQLEFVDNSQSRVVLKLMDTGNADVVGALGATSYKARGVAGLSATVVLKGSDGKNCNLVISGGIVTGTTCPKR